MLYHGQAISYQSCYMLYHGQVLLHAVPWSSDDQCLVTASLCPPPSDSTLRQPIGNTTLSTAVHRLYQHPSTLLKGQRSEERGQTPCLIASAAVFQMSHITCFFYRLYCTLCTDCVHVALQITSFKTNKNSPLPPS